MTMPTVTPQRFCTDTLPVATRVAQVRESYASLDMAVDLRPLVDECAFRLDLCSTRLNASASLGGGSLSPYVARRSRAAAAPASSDAVMITRFSQPFQVSSGPLKQVTVAAGDTLVVPMDESFEFIYPTAGTIQTIWLQRTALRPLLPRLDDQARRFERQGAGAHLDVLFGYAASIQRQTSLDASLASLSASHLTDLLALALGAGVGPAEPGQAHGGHAARMAAVHADVARTFRQPRLTVAHLAQRHHMSVRQLQRLFEQEGTTFTAHLQNTRLEHVRRALQDPANTQRRVSVMAYEAGFQDLAAFNRLFRQRFGTTPTQLREAMSQGVHHRPDGG